MDSPLKWLTLFAAIIGLGYGAIAQEAQLYALYKTYVNPDPPPPPAVVEVAYVPPVEEAPVEKDQSGFKIGSNVYAAGLQDVLGWDQVDIPLHYTWEGSSETDKQTETWTVKHGTKVKILDIKSGRGGTWYRVETQEQFRHRGWVLGAYLRASKPADSDESKDWQTAKDDAEKRNKERLAEQERQKRLLEEARRRRGG